MALLNPQNEVANLPRKNQWAFLDEIEAPMWVDLTLEIDSTYEDKDDEWFHISHPIHQSSAKQLKHKISGPSSPELPSSVSKSRGKDYKARIKAPIACGLTLNKLDKAKSLNRKSKSSAVEVVSKKAVGNKAFSGFPNKTTTSAKSAASVGGENNSKGTSRQSCSSKSSVGPSLQNRTDSKRNQITRSQVSSNNMYNRSTMCKDSSSLNVSRDAKKAKDHIKVYRAKNYTQEVHRRAIPKATTKSTKAGRIECHGKENQETKIISSINPSTKLKEAEPEVDNKVKERKVVLKGDDKTKISIRKGNSSSAREVNKNKNTGKVARVYFR